MDKDTYAVLVSGLKACTTRNVLEDTFKRYDVNDFAERIECLNKCMGDPKTFFSAGEDLDIKNKYELTVEMFLTGAWKILL